MFKSYIKNQLQEKYVKWITQPIYINASCATLPRHAAIYILCEEGIVPLLQSFGYECHYTTKELTKELLRILYHYKSGKRVIFKNLQRGAPRDQFQHFLEMFETDTLFGFWLKWEKMDDFTEDAYGYTFRFDLPFFLWNVLNLKLSSEYQSFAKELEEGSGDVQDKTKGKDDPFLSDLQSDVLVYDKYKF